MILRCRAAFVTELVGQPDWNRDTDPIRKRTRRRYCPTLACNRSLHQSLLVSNSRAPRHQYIEVADATMLRMIPTA